MSFFNLLRRVIALLEIFVDIYDIVDSSAFRSLLASIHPLVASLTECLDARAQSRGGQTKWHDSPGKMMLVGLSALDMSLWTYFLAWCVASLCYLFGLYDGNNWAVVIMVEILAVVASLYIVLVGFAKFLANGIDMWQRILRGIN